jgi:hypothetical protein
MYLCLHTSDRIIKYHANKHYFIGRSTLPDVLKTQMNNNFTRSLVLEHGKVAPFFSLDIASIFFPHKWYLYVAMSLL